jgi:hypothetical protein
MPRSIILLREASSSPDNKKIPDFYYEATNSNIKPIPWQNEYNP